MNIPLPTHKLKFDGHGLNLQDGTGLRVATFSDGFKRAGDRHLEGKALAAQLEAAPDLYAALTEAVRIMPRTSQARIRFIAQAAAILEPVDQGVKALQEIAL